jgi:hypothetical protein
VGWKGLHAVGAPNRKFNVIIGLDNLFDFRIRVLNSRSFAPFPQQMRSRRTAACISNKFAAIMREYMQPNGCVQLRRIPAADKCNERVAFTKR